MSNDSYKTVEGEIEAVNNRNGQEFYGLLVNDDWQNGRNPMPEDLEKGMKVAIKSDPEADFYNIEDIKILEEAEESAGSVSEGATSSAQQGNKGDKSASHNSSYKQVSIQAQTATKLAAEQASVRPGENQAKHLDEVNELANGYLNIIRGLSNQ